MNNPDFLQHAPAHYVWPQCPEADQFIRARLDAFLEGHSFARKLSERMMTECSTEFQSWVDHIIIPRNDFSSDVAARLGFQTHDEAKAPAGSSVYWHPHADLPRLVASSDASALSCAIMVESISDFELAHGLSLYIEGAPFSMYREARLGGERGDLRLIERRGTRYLIPDRESRATRYLSNLELWLNRPRKFARLDDGLKHTQMLAETMVRNLGSGMAAWAFLEGERRYWQTRNRAGQVQKSRQDKLGLGWANHDHHTFRSSRPAFRGLMQILKTFGFKKRERYYAGADAGWGAQILEQPEANLIIFADVDLNPDEVTIDFASEPLLELERPGTIGLWCGLHGESILEAGMHHLEAKFNFDQLKNSLQGNVSFMKPFSDFPHLRQAFSEGEWWPVPVERLNSLLASKKLSPEAYDKIKVNGAVGSHLENLQRRNGFKGFNQKGVSQIIKEVNPESQALKEKGDQS